MSEEKFCPIYSLKLNYIIQLLAKNEKKNIFPKYQTSSLSTKQVV